MVFPHTNSKNPSQLKKFTHKIPNFHQNSQILNFPLFFNENRTSQKIHPLSNPISTKPFFHNTFQPSLTQNLTKNFHKFTLPSQLSSLYKGIFTMYYFYVKKPPFRKHPASTLWRHTRLSIHSRILQSLSVNHYQ